MYQCWYISYIRFHGYENKKNKYKTINKSKIKESAVT